MAFYACRLASPLDASQTVLVLGAGPIGQCLVAAAAAAHGARVIVSDPLPLRRSAAMKLGAAVSVDASSDDNLQEIMSLTSGEGADVVMEASGHPAAQALALAAAAYNGRVVFVGINVKGPSSADLGLVQGKGLCVYGAIGSPDVWPTAIRFLARTGIDLAPIVTATYPLSLAAEALTAARQIDENIKVQIDPSRRSEAPAG